MKKMKCPVCEGVIHIFGSECYPEYGFNAECEDCDYEMTMTVSTRVDNLRSIVEKTQEMINENIQLRNFYLIFPMNFSCSFFYD